ncbi:hypothetical protein G6F32_016929 [Rhizopus arrhizus]|nr:hypothetical protein G6F32_016929 [Rhizopus arrhizus]
MAQHRWQRGEQRLHVFPAHDVQRVGAERGVECAALRQAEAGCRRKFHLQRQRRQQGQQGRFGAPCLDARQVVGMITGLPAQPRPALGKERGVLAGAAADFQQPVAVAHPRVECGGDRFAVALAGF